MALHNRMKKLIDRMSSVKKYGTEGVTINIPSGEFNPATGEFEPETITVGEGEEATEEPVLHIYNIQVIASSYNDYLLSKDTIEQSDVNLTVALFEDEPTIGSIVNMHSKDYQVLNVRRIDVQGVVIGWQLQLRV